MDSEKPIKSGCAFLLEWATRTETLKLPASGKPQAVKAIKDHINSCLAIVPAELEEKAVEGGSVLGMIQRALKAVTDLLGRWTKVCEAGLFEALLSGDVPLKDCQQLLPPELLSLAHCLETNWETEVEDLKSAASDLESLFAKVEKFQSAHSLVDGKKDGCELDALKQAKELCQKFRDQYLSSLDLAVQSTKELMFPPLERFIEKYKAVEKAVEDWEMAPVDWVFANDNEDETKKDIEDFKQARAQALETMGTLRSFEKYLTATTCSDLKKVLERGLDLFKLGVSTTESGGKLVAIILFTHCVINNLEFEGVNAYVTNTFGEKNAIGHLPEKLEKQVALQKNKRTAEQKSEGKQKKEKKDKSKNKDKDKKKDKDKDQDHDHKDKKEPKENASSTSKRERASKDEAKASKKSKK